jgi:hypothetical protein
LEGYADNSLLEYTTIKPKRTEELYICLKRHFIVKLS